MRTIYGVLRGSGEGSEGQGRVARVDGGAGGGCWRKCCYN
jgi:hypothetical protein